MNLPGKVVLLTGASSGIGWAAAQALAEAGCHLSLAARTAGRLEQLARSLTAGGTQVIFTPTDLSRPGDIRSLVEETAGKFGRIDILINNAAIGQYDAIADLDIDDMRYLFEVNLFGPVHLIRGSLPLMPVEGGLIINISSIIGRRGLPLSGSYCASKAALERLAESLRLELRARNIRVSTIYPGVTATPFVKNSLGGRARRLPRQRQGVPAERVAKTIVRVARREPRDAFVTLFDRVFVLGSQAAPWLTDWLLARYFSERL
ncbi:MAG: SDR family NAD(P)-dependent oxidoreductase [Anaerolineae bacterium]